MDSSRTKALELWGDISFATNQTRQSRDAWVRCMKEDPNYVRCRLKMAQLYHVVTEFEKSAALVDEVLEIEPSNAQAAYLKGLLMRDALEDTTRALDWFQKAIDLKPDYIEALDMSGVLYSSLGNPLALGYFNRLIELQPDIRVHFYNRGMFYLGQQNWNGALEDFTKCTQLDPQDLESFFNIGYVHLQLQLYADARQYFTQALAIQPVNHRALYGRGYCFELLGDLPNAEADYRQALSFNLQHRGSQEGLARIERARAQQGQ
jgi:tetratricopeptide (TPR) repeat protein